MAERGLIFINKYDKISKRMEQSCREFNEILGNAFLKKQQDEALLGLKDFFQRLNEYECEKYTEADSSSLRSSFLTYSSFYAFLTEFRICYLNGDYSKAAYALSEAIDVRSCTYRGARAAILEAGKIVMKDDFPK
ncbi:hypothetical protein [Ruminococcus sp. YE71]|uniref:hypothetical protein n=1 Tax=Ruminococcus sp. YE71 TaxID=244362 RepID=UPI0011137E8A|nr:hypothetical protein [Ruminococcus sp. YE71]